MAVLHTRCSSFNPDDTKVVEWDKSKHCERQLQILPGYTANKTLGYYKEPAGVQKEQYRRLKSHISDSIANFLWLCSLTRLEAWTFYYACYLPSILCYPLAWSSLTPSQLDAIQRKAMSIIVPRCGYNRNTKKEILYGPLSLGGVNFCQLSSQQEIS